MKTPNHPMTTAEACEKYRCKYCRAHGDDGMCLCVESQTCSFPCPECGERIWFRGDLHKAPLMFACPYCGEVSTNKWAERWLIKNYGGRHGRT
jgi:predicted RNA-binding Zn-ribbon protein involved in translation (DUF1610 family)